MYPGFRGQHALVRDSLSKGSKCVACMRCATVCPSHCIQIGYDEDETHKRIVNKYTIEVLRCVFCGYCVEVCPVGAITMTELFEYATYDRKTVFFDQEALLENWDSFISKTGKDATYVNPLMRPRGIPESLLPAAQRLKVPDEWTIEGQYVGPKARPSTVSLPTTYAEVENG